MGSVPRPLAQLSDPSTRLDNAGKGEVPMFEEKPTKFINAAHEKRTEISFHKKKLIMRVELEDFIPHIKGYSESMSADYVLKNPVMYSNRVTAVKYKIYNNTGIPPNQLDITRISIPTKRVELCWISFEKERTVNEIFRLAVVNGNARNFNAFPHIPAKAMACKEGIEKILKRIQAVDNMLRYQVRMGTDDLVIKIKYQFKDDYRPYVSIKLEDLDPNDTVPEWDLVMDRRKDDNSKDKVKDPFEWNTKGPKRNASRSPEDRSSKRSNREEVDDFQIAEFIHAFLEGTATKSRYQNLNWNLEAATDFGGEAEEELGASSSHEAVLEEPEDGAAPPDPNHGAAPAQAELLQGAAPAQADLN